MSVFLYVCTYISTYLYNNFTGSDYYASTTFARFSAGTTETSFYIGTREDSILEEQCEDFIVHVKYASKPGSTTCDNATVTIKDDDGTYIHKCIGPYFIMTNIWMHK